MDGGFETPKVLHVNYEDANSKQEIHAILIAKKFQLKLMRSIIRTASFNTRETRGHKSALEKIDFTLETSSGF